MINWATLHNRTDKPSDRAGEFGLHLVVMRPRYITDDDEWMRMLKYQLRPIQQLVWTAIEQSPTGIATFGPIEIKELGAMLYPDGQIGSMDAQYIRRYEVLVPTATVERREQVILVPGPVEWYTHKWTWRHKIRWLFTGKLPF